MPKKTTTLYIRRVDADFMHLVREFCVHREITIKEMTLAAIDEYMTRHKEEERKQGKEV